MQYGDKNTDRKVTADTTVAMHSENVLANRYGIRAYHDVFADTAVAGIRVSRNGRKLY